MDGMSQPCIMNAILLLLTFQDVIQVGVWMMFLVMSHIKIEKNFKNIKFFEFFGSESLTNANSFAET